MGEEAGVMVRVRHDQCNSETNADRYSSFNDVYPAPALDSICTVHLEEADGLTQGMRSDRCNLLQSTYDKTAENPTNWSRYV